MRRVSPSFATGFVLLCLVVSGNNSDAQTRCPAPAASTLKNPVAANKASITAGGAAFMKYCAFCHNADGKGNGPLAPKDSNPPDLTDAKWVHGSTDSEIFATISNGVPDTKMVCFKGKMPDQDLWHIVNYLRSLGPKNAKR
jgi:mono/diheme cytochrome c family protein